MGEGWRTWVAGLLGKELCTLLMCSLWVKTSCACGAGDHR